MFEQVQYLIALCTGYQLPWNCQTLNHARRVFTFHHLMYLNTFDLEHLFLNTVFKQIKIKVSINTMINI